MVFDVYLSFPVDFEVTVDYTTVDGTAVAGRDYTSTTGTLTFPPGTTEATVTVPLLNDSEDERNESFTLEVYNPVDGFIDNPGERFELTGTIRGRRCARGHDLLRQIHVHGCRRWPSPAGVEPQRRSGAHGRSRDCRHEGAWGTGFGLLCAPDCGL